VQDVTHKDDLPAVAAQVNQVISGRRNSYQIEKRYLNKTGQEVWVLISASVVHDRDGRPNYFITEVQDIGDRKRLMAEMERLAHHDPLTGVPNRRAFDQRLRDEILTSRRHKRQFSLGLFDIDKFKTFNDTYGHPAGDEILREIGHILSQTLRPNDFAGRYGGEEFVFILPETSESEAVSAAERLRKVIAGHNWQIAPVTASFGLATWTGEDAQTLLAGADLALYGAKRAGRNRVVHRNSMPAEPES
jgi:diguanylate cyclase (GGDEF)-like protein